MAAGVRASTAVLFILIATPAPGHAYSVLAHEAMIDTAWKEHLAPILRNKFPRASDDEVTRARAYAYGGSVIQDLGYYPFGSRLFSNLVHYVSSGDFVESLIRNARDINEYAFALGALAHYASDNVGHPNAVNRAVPIIYPKLGAKYGPEVLYAASPSHHIMVEFAFDVVEVARGAFKADAYQTLIGFEVATPVLERAFRETYGLELKDVFGDTDIAIGTYRRAVSQVIPDVTRLAWQEKRDDILAATPGVTERDVVYRLTSRQYDEAYGTTYRKPGFLARFVVMILKIVPKFGPFKPLAFEPLTSDTEQMFAEAFKASHDRYSAWLRTLRSGKVQLSGLDLDTGKRPTPGRNPLADETYADLLEKLAEKKFTDVPSSLRLNINEYYVAKSATQAATGKPSKRQREAPARLAALNASVQR
jgi:hypothetical protein